MDTSDTTESLKAKIKHLETRLHEAVTAAASSGEHDQARQAIRTSLEDIVRIVAKQERERCVSAVAGTWDKMEGTPYYCGPRKFCDAIRKLPAPSEVYNETLKEAFDVQ
jgi:ferredoxin-NADP reductase